MSKGLPVLGLDKGDTCQHCGEVILKGEPYGINAPGDIVCSACGYLDLLFRNGTLAQTELACVRLRRQKDKLLTERGYQLHQREKLLDALAIAEDLCKAKIAPADFRTVRDLLREVLAVYPKEKP